MGATVPSTRIARNPTGMNVNTADINELLSAAVFGEVMFTKNHAPRLSAVVIRIKNNMILLTIMNWIKPIGAKANESCFKNSFSIKVYVEHS